MQKERPGPSFRPSFLLKSLQQEDLKKVIHQALTDERGLSENTVSLEPEAEEVSIRYADGDARRVLNILEVAADLCHDGVIRSDSIMDILSDTGRRFDKGGEAFYDQISAFHKSVRGSSPDGALYWAARMVDGGADPLYIIRRLVAIASEDIGNADPRALDIAINAWQAFERLGAPEPKFSS
ncbi:hypothetical protein [Endozoicomonas ascidiicola]|uniref:AAA family ATPase n=1 Tax=Endozoicomonas ascidiicola TaxID=1698521 RepID=UPI00082A4332|nr:hypothetical protein [Endozoicomonas ascidiicola]